MTKQNTTVTNENYTKKFTGVGVVVTLFTTTARKLRTKNKHPKTNDWRYLHSPHLLQTTPSFCPPEVKIPSLLLNILILTAMAVSVDSAQVCLRKPKLVAFDLDGNTLNISLTYFLESLLEPI